MAYIIEKIVPTPEEIIKEFPVSNQLKEKILVNRKEITQIIEGADKRKLLIIGPCSAWPDTAVISYAKKIKKISDKVKDKIKIVLRVYTQKPRTSLGWTGSSNQKNPYEISDIENGIKYCRQMMLDVIDIGLPIADEALFTHNFGYFNDLLSWVVIGARSSEDQEHRIFASMLEHPVGIKNPTSGNLNIAINSIIAAQHSHVYLLNGNQIRTLGNEHAHLVLRGGNGKSNIFLDDLENTYKNLEEKGVKNPTIIVDVSHDNSIDPSTNKKDPLRQTDALIRVLEHMKKDDKNLNKYIKGFMVESFIKSGNQNLNEFKSVNELNLDGLSITDPCIGIDETVDLIDNIYNELK